MYFYPLSNHLRSLKNLFESVCIQGEIGIRKKKEETEIPGENSHKARIRTNNKHTHVWHLCWYSNLGHICVS